MERTCGLRLFRLVDWVILILWRSVGLWPISRAKSWLLFSVMKRSFCGLMLLINAEKKLLLRVCRVVFLLRCLLQPAFDLMDAVLHVGVSVHNER